MTAPDQAGARNRARIAIMDGLDSASLDDLTVISKAVARIAVLRETGAKEAPLWWSPMSELDNALRIELADRRREREQAGGGAHEAPRVDGAAPTYEGRPLSEALTEAERRLRATTILDVLRGLQDRASLAEIIVTARCLQRIEVIRREPPREPGDRPCGLDDALRLELTDVWIEREQAQHEAARDEAVGAFRTQGEAAKAWLAEEVDSADACLHPFGHDWMTRGPIQECRLCGVSQGCYGVMIPAETAHVLRDADISTDDRAGLTELLGATQEGDGSCAR